LVGPSSAKPSSCSVSPSWPISSASPPYEALYQRIAVRYQIPPFDLEETAGYVKHHLRVAGFQGSLFSDSFVGGVHDHTKGVARKINNLCRSALLLGASGRKQLLDETDLKRVILDLEGSI
jgi:type II secretory pathway predicted ATPase ExeA